MSRRWTRAQAIDLARDVYEDDKTRGLEYPFVAVVVWTDERCVASGAGSHQEALVEIAEMAAEREEPVRFSLIVDIHADSWEDVQAPDSTSNDKGGEGL